jgi:hypothetical protein
VSSIFVRGCGAVSPAGWGVAALIDALDKRAEIPPQPLPSPTKQFTVRTVPAPNPRPAFLAHPRLRRASVISQYATAAALEALGNLRGPEHRLGIVVGVHAASIRYSEKFFFEVLRDPTTASPLLFPETVINAPASHLAANINATHLTYSVLGDQTAFIQALAVAAGWLTNDRVDIALVVSAEETSWTVSAAANFFSRQVICSEGAGALCLMRDSGENSIELTSITDPVLFTDHNRDRATQKIAAQFLPGSRDDMLCDGRTGSARWDAAESRAWREWQGSTLSPREILGEGLSAATAWQFIAAVERLRSNRARTAVISAAGSNQQAIAARLQRHG